MKADDVIIDSPDLTLRYDAQRIESVFRLSYLWTQPWQTIPFLKRLLAVWLFLLRFLFYTWWDEQVWTYLGEKDVDRSQSARRRRHAHWLTEQLLVFGPTFIKVGQQISSRVDLIRKEYIETLAKLQDRVPPFPIEQARIICESELGKTPEQLFEWFDPHPLAAASLGQVHRGRLANGRELIIKIQRPNLVRTFELDLAILRKIARYCETYWEFSKGRDWVDIVDEFGRTLFSEVDYIQEGRHADTFRKQFRYSNLAPYVHFPEIYWPFTSRRIICMEYAPGTKINDVHTLARKGFDLPFLAQTVIKTFFEQILVHGFYHADPHPGNLAIRDDGVIIFYDFGMVGRIPDKSRRAVVDTFLNIVAKKPDQLLENLIELDMLAPTADLEVIRDLLVWALDNYYDVPHDQLNFETLTDELAEVMYEHPFKLPANITFMIRSLVTLEGIATGLHPQMKLLSAAVEYAQTFVGKTIDFQYVVKKVREWLGLGDSSGNQRVMKRVRLQADEWTPLARYIRAGFIVLGLGQLGLLMLVSLVLVLQTGHWQLTMVGWVLLGLVAFLFSLFGLLILALLPNRKPAVRFQATVKNR